MNTSGTGYTAAELVLATLTATTAITSAGALTVNAGGAYMVGLFMHSEVMVRPTLEIMEAMMGLLTVLCKLCDQHHKGQSTICRSFELEPMLLVSGGWIIHLS